MPVVPTQRQPLRAVPQEAPDPKYLAMAAAMMHAQGKLFTPVGTSEMGAISRYGRPNVKADVATADRLKAIEQGMENRQKEQDENTEERLEPIKDQRI